MGLQIKMQETIQVLKLETVVINSSNVINPFSTADQRYSQCVTIKKTERLARWRQFRQPAWPQCLMDHSLGKWCPVSGLS